MCTLVAVIYKFIFITIMQPQTTHSHNLLLLIGVLVLGIGFSCAFEQESVFEDEDIFRQALPPAQGQGITIMGTKWCGPGNTAKNYTDLGTQRDTDICCRDHDHCEQIIESGCTLHDLSNPGIFPILKCSCEQQFLNCLQNVNTIVSTTLGRIYFGTRGKCFGLGHPIRGCKEYQRGTFRRRCIRYEVDETQLKVWQFYDMPFFTL